MNFKEWFLQETRFKGLRRMFDKEFPDMPKYMKNDIYNGRVAYTMSKLIGDDSRMAPTISVYDSSSPGFARTTDDYVPSNAPSRIFGKAPYRNYKFTPQPITLNLSPLDFTEENIKLFLRRKFGFHSIEDEGIDNDEQRNILQRKNVNSQEPVILLKKGNKYHLLEGWHRVMAKLVLLGAPKEHLEKIKSGYLQPKELMQWGKVPINSFVGVEKFSMKKAG